MEQLTGKVDHVAQIQAANTAIVHAQKQKQQAMEQLHIQVIEKVKWAFSRVFGSGNGVDFPQERHMCSAIPHLWDNVRLDFEGVFEKEILLGQKEDQETGISFFGYRVDWPVPGIVFEARVPLVQLSSSGIEKIV